MVSLLGDVKPLKEYLLDKKEMIEVMFSCIEENQLKKMIPDVLKDARLEDVKAECLVELLGMSKKRIIGILDGRELEESSEDSLELSDISEDDDDIIKSERKTPDKTNRKKDRKEVKSSATKKNRRSSTSDSDREEVSLKKKKTKKKVEESPAKEAASKKVNIQSRKKTKGGESCKDSKEENPLPEPQTQIQVPAEEKQGKNLLEILELEMRARAIRSLLQREEKKNKAPGEGEPSTSLASTDASEPLDNDPDAVILIDETADQIDLTKDDSDSEQQANSKEDDRLFESSKDKPTTSQIRNYRSNKAHSPTISLKAPVLDSDKDPTDLSDLSKKDKSSERCVPKNWTERWLDSNDVQKVMKTTKVLTNLKKRLIRVNKQKSEEKNEGPEEKVPIEGTVAEYARLDSKLTDNIDVRQTETHSQADISKSASHNGQDAEPAVETFIGEDEMKTITESGKNDVEDEVKTFSDQPEEPHPLERSSVCQSEAATSPGAKSKEVEPETDPSIRSDDSD